MSEEHEHRARFRELYLANHVDLARYALRRAASPEDAADIVADTFLIAWRRLEQIPSGGQARLWLFGVARRVLANRRRAEARRDQLTQRLRVQAAGEPTAGAPGSPEPGPALDGALAALARLRQDQRDLLGLVAWEGLTTAELASVLGCSGNAAKIRLHRARRRFAQELARGEPEPGPERSAADAGAGARAGLGTTVSNPMERA